MREVQVEQHLIIGVQRLGGVAKKLKLRNDPDRMVLLPYCLISFVELKAPGKKASPGQLREHARLRGMGFSVHVLDSIKAVDEFLATAQTLLAWKRGRR